MSNISSDVSVCHNIPSVRSLLQIRRITHQLTKLSLYQLPLRHLLKLHTKLSASPCQLRIQPRQVGVVHCGEQMVQSVVSKYYQSQRLVSTHFYPVSGRIQGVESPVPVLPVTTLSHQYYSTNFSPLFKEFTCLTGLSFKVKRSLQS